jgi:glycerol uptake facilitator-like aquaporin
MFEFLLGILAGLLVPSVSKWCCGCLVALLGGFALLAIVFALAAEGELATTRLFVGIMGLAIGLLALKLIKKLTQ